MSYTALHFMFTYLPLTLTVAVSFFWELLDVNVRRLESFHALAQPKGTLLKDSLSLDYDTAFTYVIPYKSWLRSHWAVTLSSTLYILEFTALPVLASVLWKLSPYDSVDDSEFQLAVKVNQVFVILAIALLLATVLLGVALAVVLQRRSYGLHGDPGGISGIASLVAGSNALDAFRRVRSYDSQAAIDDMLQHCRFALMPTDQGYQIHVIDQPEYSLSTPRQPFVQNRGEAHSWWLWGRSYIGLSILVLIPFVYIELATLGTVPVTIWALEPCTALISTVNAAIWQNWQHHTANLEPYYQMANERSSRNAISFDFTNSPISSMFQAMRTYKRAPIVSYISFCTFINQVAVIFNPIAITLGVRLGEVDGELWELSLSDQRALVMVSAMGLVQMATGVLGVILMLTKRRKPFMPRKPWTLSSTIMYLCHSDVLLDDVKGMATMDKKERDRCLRARWVSYKFGWFEIESREEGRLGVVGVERDDKVTDAYLYKQMKPMGKGWRRQD